MAVVMYCMYLDVRLDVIPEMEVPGSGVSGEVLVGGSGPVGRECEDEEAMAVPVMVVSERGQLSENPETGQSEVEQEEVQQEVSPGQQEMCKLEQEVNVEVPVVDLLSGGGGEVGRLVLGSEELVKQVAGLQGEQTLPGQREADQREAIEKDREEDVTQPSPNIQLGEVSSIVAVSMTHILLGTDV